MSYCRHHTHLLSHKPISLMFRKINQNCVIGVSGDFTWHCSCHILNGSGKINSNMSEEDLNPEIVALLCCGCKHKDKGRDRSFGFVLINFLWSSARKKKNCSVARQHAFASFQYPLLNLKVNFGSVWIFI